MYFLKRKKNTHQNENYTIKSMMNPYQTMSCRHARKIVLVNRYKKRNLLSITAKNQ